jgi:DNA-binding FadR family transcriptional regulator
VVALPPREAATLSVNGYRKRVWSEHAAILRAIAAGRPAQAQALSIAHTRAARAVLLGKLKQVLTERTVARRAGRARRERRGRVSARERAVGA